MGGTLPPGRSPGFLPVDSVFWRPRRLLARRGRRGPVRRGGKEAVNPSPKAGAGGDYAAATRAHSESVCVPSYDLHLEAGTGPMVNPFPRCREPGGAPGELPTTPGGALRDERSAGTVPLWCSDAAVASGQEVFFDQCSLALRPTDRPLSPSGCRPGPGPRSCWAPRQVIQIRTAAVTVIRKGRGSCSQLRHRRTHSSGCGCIRLRWRAWCLPGDHRVWWICCARSAGWPTTAQ